MKNILHIINTNPARDSRIHKEIIAFSKIRNVKIVAIGVSDISGVDKNMMEGTDLIYLSLMLRKFQFLDLLPQVGQG